MSRAASTAQAALLLAALLFGVSLPGDPPELRPCAAPAERAAEDGRTREIGCAGGAALRGPARLLFGQRIDPNRADAATLEVLPGIGPARAAAIVAARSERPFDRVDDLGRVPGIGPVTLDRIRALLAVEGGGGDASPR